MSKKNTGMGNGLVYSTNKDMMNKDEEFEEMETLPPAKQKLRVKTDSKQRAGKLVTLVEGFEGKQDDMETLGKLLKTKCSTGGTVKDGMIIIQGDYKEKIVVLLKELGYSLGKQAK